MKKLITSILMIILIFTIISCSNTNDDLPETTSLTYAQELFNSKNEHIADNAANINILELLKIGDELGDYEVAAVTSIEPYVLKLRFKNRFDNIEKRTEFDSKIIDKAFLILALIYDAKDVHWSYPIYENGEESLIIGYLSASDAKYILSRDIKEFGESANKLQELLDYLELNK